MNHSSHNSFKLAVKDGLQDVHTMKQMWGVIEGLRTCYTTLMEYALPWVASCLCFRDSDMTNAYHMWSMLCMDNDIAEELTVLQLRCLDGKIFVAQEFENELGIVDRVVAVLKVCFRWRKWTDSRWLSIGDTSRSLLTSLIFGVAGLIQFALASGHSAYYLAAAKSMSEDIKRLAVNCAIVSFVADAVLGVLLTDDRLPVMIDCIDEEMNSEAEFVLSIPWDIWSITRRPQA